MLILYACTGPLWTRNGCCRVHGPVLAHHSDAFWVMDGGHIVSESEFRAFEYLALARPNLVGRRTLTNSNYFLPNWQWRPFEIIFIKNSYFLWEKYITGNLSTQECINTFIFDIVEHRDLSFSLKGWKRHLKSFHTRIFIKKKFDIDGPVRQ